MKNGFILLLVCMISVSCKKEKLPPINDAVDLDGKLISDSSLIVPSNFLLSAANPNPSAADLQKKVVITVHGFSASNFEWLDFNSWAKSKTDVVVSRVLLGGHGRNYVDFQKASWGDWQQPIIDEYNKLVAMGYVNVSLAGSSTGCPLILDLIEANKINTTPLKNIFLVDPIIIPSNKILPLAPIIGGWAVEYTTTELNAAENGYWYKYRPHQALKQLDKLTRHLRKKLEKGIDLPAGTSLVVFKSTKDDAADPASAALIKKGIIGATIKMIESNLHVFTRLTGRAIITADDKVQQLTAFEDMYNEL